MLMEMKNEELLVETLIDMSKYYTDFSVYVEDSNTSHYENVFALNYTIQKLKENNINVLSDIIHEGRNKSGYTYADPVQPYSNNKSVRVITKYKNKYWYDLPIKCSDPDGRRFKKYWENHKKYMVDYNRTIDEAIYRAINLLCKKMKIASVYTTNETIRQYCIDNDISMTDKPNKEGSELDIVINGNLEYVRSKYAIHRNSAYMEFRPVKYCISNGSKFTDNSLCSLIEILIEARKEIVNDIHIYLSKLDKLLTWIEQDKEEIMRIAA